MKHITQALLIVVLCVQSAHGFQAKEKQAKKKRARPSLTFEQRFPEGLKQTPDSEERLDKWFRDAKFGAFIHFGAYSQIHSERRGRIATPRKRL